MNTEVKTNTRTKQILVVMHILTWIAFIGLCVQTGAILISYGVSRVNGEGAKDLFSVSFIAALSGMKAYVLYLVIKALSKVNLVTPFKIEVVRILEKMSYVLFGCWIISILNNAYASGSLKSIAIIQQGWSNEEFIFMAGIVFIISQVFKRGVEIQSENDLTV